MKLNPKERDEIVAQIHELRQSGMIFKEIAQILSEKFNRSFSVDSVNSLYWRHKPEERSNISFIPKEERGINEDGVFRDARYFEVNINEPLGPNEVLLAHGFDPDKFEIVTAGSTGSKIGTGNNDEQFFINTYRKLTVRVKEIKLTELDCIQILNSTKIDPIHIEPRKTTEKSTGLYEIPIFDAHFGVATYEDYKPHQAEIFRYISGQRWEQVLFVIGQDLFHNDDFRGRTANGTPIDKSDMEKAVLDAKSFYYPLIDEALRQSDHVKIIFSRGNHDESFGWWFVNLLGERYPQVQVDGSMKEFKRHVYHRVFLGYNHGEKVKNDQKLIKVFNGLWRLEMAQAKVRIIKRGHWHTMSTLDDDGSIVMGLSTAAPTDEYNENNGFVYSHKVFQTFIYNHEGVKAQVYIDGQ